MVNIYERHLELMPYAPDGTRVLLSLERDGYPKELISIIHRRFWKILERHALLAKPPLTRLHVEKLVQRLLAKVCRELISFVTTLAQGMDATEARRILRLPFLGENDLSALRKRAA